jgi:dienelactone hydrolase
MRQIRPQRIWRRGDKRFMLGVARSGQSSRNGLGWASGVLWGDGLGKGGWCHTPGVVRGVPGNRHPYRDQNSMRDSQYQSTFVMYSQIRAMNMMHVSATRLLGIFLCLVAACAHSQSPVDSAYTEVFYPSGSLRIQAYLYKPDGDGPFPVVIYNHGSRAGRERRSMPFEYIGRLLTRAGYVVLVPERRGYGGSDGPTWSEDVGNDRGQRFIARLQEETDDVLAARDYLRTLPFADTKRIGIMGWSLGGIVTMFAVSRSSAFAVAIDQAGAALTWDGSAQVRSALIAAAEHGTTPALLLVAQNDRTTASITTLADIFTKRGVPHRMVIYEPFAPQQAGGAATAPGHMVFSAQGTQVWERDVLEFLGRYLGVTSTGTPSRAEPAKSQQ